jgi:hypothetical protein
MCRKEATEMEDCAPQPEEEEEEEDEEESYGYVGGTIRITWTSMDNLIYTEGGHGITPGVEEDVGFDEYREAVITRYDFERILRQQGIGPFSDARWLQLQSIFPDDDEDEVPPSPVAEPPRQLTFAPPPPPPPAQNNEQRKREIVGQLSRLAAELALLMGPPLPVAEPLEDDEDDLVRLSRIEIVEAEEEAIHVPGPFDFVADLPTSPRFTLKRDDIQRLLLRHGSKATMEEFFNEEDGEEQTLVVTMTLESLNARFLSLAATPVTFMEATVAVATPETEIPFMEVKTGGPWPRLKTGGPVLNPEDDEPELGV